MQARPKKAEQTPLFSRSFSIEMSYSEGHSSSLNYKKVTRKIKKEKRDSL